MVKYDSHFYTKLALLKGKRQGGLYQFSHSQHILFADLYRKYGWNRFSINYMKKLIIYHKFSTYLAFKKVVMERNL